MNLNGPDFVVWKPPDGSKPNYRLEFHPLYVAFDLTSEDPTVVVIPNVRIREVPGWMQGSIPTLIELAAARRGLRVEAIGFDMVSDTLQARLVTS